MNLQTLYRAPRWVLILFASVFFAVTYFLSQDIATENIYLNQILGVLPIHVAFGILSIDLFRCQGYRKVYPEPEEPAKVKFNRSAYQTWNLFYATISAACIAALPNDSYQLMWSILVIPTLILWLVAVIMTGVTLRLKM